MNLKMEQILAAKNAEELIALAKAEGIELSKEKAEDIFQKIVAREGELSVEELENIAGGKDTELHTTGEGVNTPFIVGGLNSNGNENDAKLINDNNPEAIRVRGNFLSR